MFWKRPLGLITAAIVISVAGAASAADLYGGGGGMKDGGYVQQAPPSTSGWYGRIDGSYAAYDVDDVNFVDLNIGTPPAGAPTAFTGPGSDVDGGWSFGGGVGRYFGRGFRGDLTLEYRGSTDVSGSAAAAPCCDQVTTETEFDGVVGLANLYYDFNRGGRFVPYIGAGIGFAHLETDGGALSCAVATAPATCAGPPVAFGDATYGKNSNTNFAVAAMAGVSVRLRGGEPQYVSGGMKDQPVQVAGGGGVYLDVGYRFLYLGDIEAANAVQTNGNEIEVSWDDLTAHEVRAGLRFDFQ